MTTCDALDGLPACSTRTTVEFSRILVDCPARSSARKLTRFCHTASTVRGPAKASGMSVFTISRANPPLPSGNIWSPSVSSPRIHHPHAGPLAKLRSEIESVIPRRLVRRVSERHLGRRSAPRLVVERGAIHSDHVVELTGVSALLRHEEDRRALVRGEPLSVDEELVALRFAAEDHVIIHHEATTTTVFLEEDRGGESADPAADGDEVVDLAGVRGVADSLFERAIAHRMSDA